jgi:hypothetical protein
MERPLFGIAGDEGMLNVHEGEQGGLLHGKVATGRGRSGDLDPRPKVASF